MIDRLGALFSQPIAHRGLHDRAAGRIENSASAFQAAINGGYGIECDIQLSADHQPLVFHDYELGRLTASTGIVRHLPSDLLMAVPLSGTDETIPPLRDILELVDGKVALIIELKAQSDGGTEIADAVHDVCAGYPGLLAIKSFDPAVIRRLRALDCPFPLGIVAERFAHHAIPAASLLTRFRLTHMIDGLLIGYDFVSYDEAGLPNLACRIARSLFGRPVMSWTVRSQHRAEALSDFVDQIVFEGFLPQSKE